VHIVLEVFTHSANRCPQLYQLSPDSSESYRIFKSPILTLRAFCGTLKVL